MPTTRLLRWLAVAGTVLACLVVPADPVAAAIHDATITDGVITAYGIDQIPQDAYDLAPFVAHCSPGTLELDVTGTGTVGVTDLDARSIVSFFGLTGAHLRVVTRIATGSTYGTLSGTGPHTISDMRVGVRVVYTSAFDWETCEPDGLAWCDVTFVLELDGTLTGTTPGSTASLTGAGVGTVAEGSWCINGFETLVGSTVAVSTPIVATLTS